MTEEKFLIRVLQIASRKKNVTRAADFYSCKLETCLDHYTIFRVPGTQCIRVVSMLD